MLSHIFNPGLEFHQYLYVCKYLNQNGSAAIKRSEGVTPEVNLENSLQIVDTVYKQEIYLGSLTQGRCYQNYKTALSVLIYLKDSTFHN